ncbi:MAG: LysE family translocator [Pseudomonadota bacterium]
MALDTALALMGFAFVMSISPGPANFLLLASGVNFGFTRSLPLVFGISAGFLSMVFLVGIGLGEVLESAPVIGTVMRIACAGYILFLAWKIARSRSMGPGEGERMERPVTVVQAALLQVLNPKAWAVALIVTVSYTDPGDYMPSLIAMIALFAVVILPSISAWAISGVALRRLIGNGRMVVIVNLVMAALLVGSMVPVLLGTFG